MSDLFPILRSLDPYHARIGYLGAVASVASRGLDHLAALSTRLDQVLFERIYQDDGRFEALMRRVPDSERRQLEKRMEANARGDPASVLSAPTKRSGWLFLSEFWLYDERMPTTRGFLPKKKLQRAIDIARWTGVLRPSLELSETGYLLQHLVASARASSSDKYFNLLDPDSHPCLRLLYLRLMLNAEMLFPFLVAELVERTARSEVVATRGHQGLLRSAVERLLAEIGKSSDPEDILARRDVIEFMDSIQGNLSTEENYLRPRMEILVDLGLLARKAAKGGKPSDFVWTVTETTNRLRDEWRGLLCAQNRIPEYLENEFFGSMGRVSDRDVVQVTSADEILYWVARAFEDVGRDFGFTPGRTLALAACFLAWEHGRVCEIGAVFDCVYAAAKSRWESFLHYSGGSRFDREFMIRIDDGLAAELEPLVRPPVR